MRTLFRNLGTVGCFGRSHFGRLTVFSLLAFPAESLAQQPWTPQPYPQQYPQPYPQQQYPQPYPQQQYPQPYPQQPAQGMPQQQPQPFTPAPPQRPTTPPTQAPYAPAPQQPYGTAPGAQPPAAQFGQQQVPPTPAPYGQWQRPGTQPPSATFGIPATPPAAEKPEPKEAWSPEARKLSLSTQTNMWGSTGLMRTSYAGSGAPGTFRVSFLLDWFATSAFLCDSSNTTEAGVPITCSASGADDEASHVGGFFTLNATPLPFLEGYASLRTYANSNSEGSPMLLQVLGDSTFGVKGFTPNKIADILTVGGELQLMFLNGTGDVGIAGSGTSFALRGLATADFSGKQGKGTPLKVNANLGYKFDNSGNLVEDIEKQRALAFSDGRDRQPISRIERYGLGINRVDFFQLHLGAELTFPKIHPYIEYTADFPVNRQDYQCHTGHVSRGDVCLGLADFGAADPTTAGGPGFSVTPSRFTFGVKTNPFEKGLSGLNAHLALDVGVTGTSTFVEEVAPQSPWTLYFGLGYAFDTQETESEKKVPSPKPPEPPLQNFVRGYVHETGRPDVAVPDAIISITGSTQAPVATGPDGRFMTRHLEVGSYLFAIKAQGYKPGTCQGNVLPRSAMPSPYGNQQFGMQGSTPGGYPAGQMTFGGALGAITPPPTPQGPNYVEVDCSLEALPKIGSISGVVKDSESGSPIAGANVKLTDATSKEQSTVTDASGAYKFDKLAPGAFSIRVDAAGFTGQSSKADVKGGEDRNASVSLAKRPKTGVAKISGSEIKLSKPITFEGDSARLTPESQAILEEVADLMARSPEIKKLEIQSHTDNAGSREKNLTLTEDRANAVRQALTTAGVNPSRLFAKGYGQDRPIAPNVTAANRSKNRRVQLIIVDGGK